MIWIFGYGSLIWKAGFEYERKIDGYIGGYQRVFYQGSTDHRGTPSHPGRTVTLIPGDPNDRVYGVAYGIEKESSAASLKTLNHREKQYDQKQYAKFFPLKPDDLGDVSISEVMFYIGTSSCVNWLGEASLQSIAMQIFSAQGPSGTNIEYLFNLADSMREMGVKEEEDSHLFQIEKIVRKLKADKAES